MTTRLNRRAWLASIGAGLAAGRRGDAAQNAAPPSQPSTPSRPLALDDFQPRSMLVVPQHPIERARFPVVDIHTHPTGRASRAGVPRGDAIEVRNPPTELLALMARRNLRTLVNLTGGVGNGLAQAIRTFQEPHPDRFAVFTEPSYDRIAEAGYAHGKATRSPVRRGRGRGE